MHKNLYSSRTISAAMTETDIGNTTYYILITITYEIAIKDKACYAQWRERREENC
jgi:hypothetical protein